MNAAIAAMRLIKFSYLNDLTLQINHLTFHHNSTNTRFPTQQHHHFIFYLNNATHLNKSINLNKTINRIYRC